MDRPRLVIAGAGGVVGRHLVTAARDRYHITVLTRRVDGDEPAGTRAVAWNPRAAALGRSDEISAVAAVLDGAQALINLAGASIAAGRLGPEHQARVLGSRVDSTETLVAANRAAGRPVEVWFQGSAVGYYGDRGEQILTEQSGGGEGLLAATAQAWERAAESAAASSRLLIGRFGGFVLAKDSPVWQRFLLPIRLFAGGALGPGDQWYTWIDADDLARAALQLIGDPAAQGAYNFTAPEPVRQLALSRAAARRLNRPALLRAPVFALRAAVGAVADEILLPSIRAVPQRLLAENFSFEVPSVERAMAKLLG